MESTIHGKTSIVLKNVKTGLVERIHSENTFQGGMIAKFLKDALDRNERNVYDNTNGAEYPYKALIGGLLLFRDPITVGSQFMPAGNVMVGKGAVDIANADAPTELGSFNSISSSASASAITQVWNFSTSQANGQIGCVCLTSKEGGMVGYGNGSGGFSASIYSNTLGYLFKSSSADDRAGALGLMADNGRRYEFTFSEGILTVKEWRTCGLTNGSVFAGLAKTYTHDLSAETGLVNFFGTGVIVSNYCGNNIIRISPKSKNIAANAYLYYIEYDCVNNTATAKTVINGYTETLSLGGSSYENGGFTADGRVMLYRTSSPYSPIIINLNDGMIVFDGTAALGNLNATHERNGIVTIGNGLYIIKTYINNIAKLAIIDTTNGTIKPIDCNYIRSLGSGGYYGSGVHGTYMSGGYYQCANFSNSGRQSAIVQMPFYLATINNLNTPVTKTSAQTMEVTYSLTEV